MRNSKEMLLWVVLNIVLCLATFTIVGICKNDFFVYANTKLESETEAKVETEEETEAETLNEVETETKNAIETEAETEKITERQTEVLISEPEEKVETEKEEEEFVWDGPVLNSYLGTITGPSGKETYYNLPMGGVVSIMRGEGFSEEEFPYWERNDGCKMLGSYIMVAADLNLRPRGTILDCSLGKAIVCDTGEFIYSNPYQLDIAVTW